MALDTGQADDRASQEAMDAIIEDVLDIGLDSLDVTTEDICFSVVDEHIQENLEDDLVKQALEQGVDLRKYAHEVETQLKKVEGQAVADYVKESRNIVALHSQICACDCLLQSLETMLCGFQADLGSISNEIQSLQAQSMAMSVQLKNRKKLQARLSQVVSEVLVPPSLIDHITTANVSEAYLDYLTALHNKLVYAKRPKTRQKMACVQEVAPELEKLRIKATERTREFLLDKILSLCKPHTNVQLLQQNTLLPYKGFCHFLKHHSKATAEEVCGVYVGSLSKIYFSLFKLYSSKLHQLWMGDVADKDDLIGTQEGTKKLFFSSRLSQKSHVFALGGRAEILESLEEAVIIPHVAAQQQAKLYIEQMFRSLTFCLMDNASHEYYFVAEFFQVKDSIGSSIFNAIFNKTFVMLRKHFADTCQASYDIVGLLLCIRIAQAYRKTALDRGITALSKFFITVEMEIWPRVKALLDLNTHSIRQWKADSRRGERADTRPHYVTRRYGELAASVNAINQTWNDQQVADSMTRMRGEMEAFLAALAATQPSVQSQTVLLINNYDLVLAILAEQGLQGGEDYIHFEQQLGIKIQTYVEEKLSSYIGDMVVFVNDYEALSSPPVLHDDTVWSAARVESIIRKFASQWRDIVDGISSDVLQTFTNFRVGTEILQAVLTNLVLYYQRFHAIMGQSPFRELPVRSELINIHHVMVEVRKRRTTF